MHTLKGHKASVTWLSLVALLGCVEVTAFTYTLRQSTLISANNPSATNNSNEVLDAWELPAGKAQDGTAMGARVSGNSAILTPGKAPSGTAEDGRGTAAMHGTVQAPAEISVPAVATTSPECATDDYGLVLAASSTTRCRVRLVVSDHACLSQDTTFFLASYDVSHDAGSVQAHQVVAEDKVELYLQAAVAGSYDLWCTDGHNHTANTQYRVNVGYEPLDVTDWRCVSYGWQVLQCCWSLPYNPAQTRSFPYLPYLTSPTALRECACDKAISCANTTCFDTRCAWTTDNGYSPTFVNLSMVFRVTNALVAGYRSFYHHADYLAIVLPDPAEHVNVEAPGATREVVVRWATPETLTQFPADLIYLLEYRLRQASSWSVGATGQCKSAKCWTSVEVEYWWQEYEVRVRLRSGAANFTLDDDGWWSDWSAVAVVTPPAEPEEAPAVGPGTFRIARNTPEYRDLTLSWRPLPTLLHNGPGFSYLVTATIYPGGASVATVNVTEPYATFTNLSTSLPYRLEVVSQNSEGRSQEGSWVVVGADNDLPDDPVLPVVVLHRQQQQYELRWHSSRRRAGDSYTLYVCVDGLMTSQPCQADLYWLTVGGVTAINITLVEFNLTEVEDTGVRFAVSTERGTNVSSGVPWDTYSAVSSGMSWDIYSAVSSGMSWDTYSAVSSGMSWDRCSTPRAYTTAHRPPTLTSPVDVSETTARVQWTLECDDWAGVVEALEVTYCLGHHNLSQDCHGESAWESEVWSGVVEVRQLAAASQYTVWLRVSFRSGLSQWSSPQHFITDSGSLSWWMVVVVVAGCVITSLLLLVFITVATRKLADTIEEVNRDIHLPEGLVSEVFRKEGSVASSEDLRQPQDLLEDLRQSPAGPPRTSDSPLQDPRGPPTVPRTPEDL